MDTFEQQNEEILNCAVELFQEKGLKFTMQDIAERMHIAKKTIYQHYDSKEAMLKGMLENGFGKIQKNKEEILRMNLPVPEKLRRVMIAMPDQYMMVDFRMLNGLHDKYPEIEKILYENLENGWEPVINLIREGQLDGSIRPVNIPVLKMMVTGALETFLSSGQLEAEGISYSDALNMMMDVIMKGLEEDKS